KLHLERALAGARARAEDLNRAWNDPRIRGIFCVRGGYGSGRLMPLLDWDALARLPERQVTIGAHTRTHPHLDQVADPTRIEDELLGCAHDLEARLGERPSIIAYPYGGLSPAVVRVARQHYQWGCTTDLRPLHPVEDPVLLPRVDVYYLREPDRIGPWGSARLRGWLWFRRGGRQLRALAGRSAA
ncbi:MAG: LD-carboxypeptidase, partial [Gemmatimonadales bacterium]|nr:LD-carboxypeptidase [Gemmatimonadales bacterium]